jgi:serine/threonine protein kinase
MYFAPEQTISGADISTVTDIWAVGVLIFHCITGKLPFAKLGDALVVIVNEICTRSQFTCFTGTKVQMLTQKAHLQSPSRLVRSLQSPRIDAPPRGVI